MVTKHKLSQQTNSDEIAPPTLPSLYDKQFRRQQNGAELTNRGRGERRTTNVEGRNNEKYNLKNPQWSLEDDLQKKSGDCSCWMISQIRVEDKVSG